MQVVPCVASAITPSHLSAANSAPTFHLQLSASLKLSQVSVAIHPFPSQPSPRRPTMPSPAFAAPATVALSSRTTSTATSLRRTAFTAARSLRISSPPALPSLSPRASASVDYESLNSKWVSDGMSPVDQIDYALSAFPNAVGIAFSGAEDVVCIEYASRTGKPYRVFALETGRLHAETLRYYATVEKHYGIKIEYTFPDTQEVLDLVNEKGLFSFYEDGHQECCRARKVRPLRKKLGTLKAWITGQRKDQSPGTRNEIPSVQVDPAFKGQAGGKDAEGELIKFNPLANMTGADVWATIRSVEVPYNALHTQGYTSIGCEPCTTTVLPNQHEREARWAWEEATQKECGLHKGNISTDAAGAELADDFVTDSIAAAPVVVFTKGDCPYCAEIMALFSELGVKYVKHEVSAMENSGDVVAALERATGQSTAPNLFIGGKHVGGNEETQNLNKAGKLIELMKTAGVETAAAV